MAMTKGYKKSEIGVIPEEWDVVPTNNLIEPNSPIRYGVVQVGSHKDDGIPIVAIKYVKEIANANLHRTDRAIEQRFTGSRVRAGDVLISIKGTIGRVGVVPEGFEGNISRELARIRPNETVTSEYLAQQLEGRETQYRISNAVVGTTRLEFSIATLRQFQIPLPPTLAEQEAIAGALSDADAWIESLEQLIAKKRQIKQGAMQELLTGKRRLPGFSGKWETKRLGDLLTFQVGFPFISSHFNENSIGLRLIKNRDLKSNDQVFYYDGPYSDQFIVRNGDVLIGMDGDFVPCWWDRGESLLNQRVGRVVTRPGLDLSFAYYALIKPLKQIESVTASTTVKHLSHGDVEGIETEVPEQTEQIAIASVLSDMDTEIESLESKLAKAREIKQGMMQELLTGRIRLV